MFVTLLPVELEFCDKIAHQRCDLADQLDRKTGNMATKKRSTALYYDKIGARSEGAAYKWFKQITRLPIEWSWKPKIDLSVKEADIEGFIDVKGVVQPHKHLMMLPGRATMPEWAYLLVDGTMHPTYKIFGWAWGHDGLEQPLRDKGTGRPAHFIDRSLLEYPWELAKHVIARRIQGGTLL